MATRENGKPPASPVDNAASGRHQPVMLRRLITMVVAGAFLTGASSSSGQPAAARTPTAATKRASSTASSGDKLPMHLPHTSLMPTSTATVSWPQSSHRAAGTGWPTRSW